MTALDSSSRTDNTRPPDAQFGPLLGVISSRAPFGVGACEVPWFVEEVGQSHEMSSRGGIFGHALKLDELGDKGKRGGCTSPDMEKPRRLGPPGFLSDGS